MPKLASSFISENKWQFVSRQEILSFFLHNNTQNIYTFIVVNSNIQTSTHPSSYKNLSQFVYMHYIYIYINLHLTRLQFCSLFPLTQPMHVSRLLKHSHSLQNELMYPSTQPRHVPSRMWHRTSWQFCGQGVEQFTS